MFLNLDVWYEIINLFREPLDEQTLRSLALTSRDISNIALGTLWQDGRSFLKIASVINSFAPSPTELFLEYICERRNDGEPRRRFSFDVAGNWHLNRPVPYAAWKRALEYLARIRKMNVYQHPKNKFNSLCLTLAMRSNSRPLLPNLWYLQTTLSGKRRDVTDDPIVSLLSPSLKVLKILTPRLPNREVAMILNLVKTCGCDLEDFTYHRDPILEVRDGTFGLFSHLQDVRTPLNYTPQPITIIKFLTSLPSLRSLACDLATFVQCTDVSSFSHDALRRIELRSSMATLRELFRRCTFPSVVEVEIQADGTTPSFEGLGSGCPNVMNLDWWLNPHLRDGELPLEFKHIAPLLSLPIRVFKMEVKKSNLTPLDLHAISESWSNLRSFQLQSHTQPLLSLAAFSNHPTIDCLNLYIPLCCFCSDIPQIPSLLATHVPSRHNVSRLRILHFNRCCSRDGHDPNLPIPHATQAEKRALLKYLLLLFPMLEKVEFMHGRFTLPGDMFLAELEETLLELKERKNLVSLA